MSCNTPNSHQIQETLREKIVVMRWGRVDIGDEIYGVVLQISARSDDGNWVNKPLKEVAQTIYKLI